MTQLGIFDQPISVSAGHPPAPAVQFNATVAEDDKPRLGKQHYKMLDRLQKGKATNVEFAHDFGLRYGARLKELRDAGHAIKTQRLKGGLFEYSLEAA